MDGSKSNSSDDVGPSVVDLGASDESQVSPLPSGQMHSDEAGLAAASPMSARADQLRGLKPLVDKGDSTARRSERSRRDRQPAISEGSSPPFFPAVSEGQPTLPNLPRRRKRAYGALISFLLLFVLPVAVFGAYFGFFASNQYVAE